MWPAGTDRSGIRWAVGSTARSTPWLSVGGSSSSAGRSTWSTSGAARAAARSATSNATPGFLWDSRGDYVRVNYPEIWTHCWPDEYHVGAFDHYFGFGLTGGAN